MDLRPCWFVQSLDDFTFLAPDGEGGVVYEVLLRDAVPFDSEEAAGQALLDHLDGHGSIVQLFRVMSYVKDGT